MRVIQAVVDGVKMWGVECLATFYPMWTKVGAGRFVRSRPLSDLRMLYKGVTEYLEVKS